MGQTRGKGSLQIRLLGELEVRVGERKVTLPSSRKARALLGYLLASDRPHNRGHLCELFWDVPDDPKAALRWCLSKLRPLVDVGSKRLLTDGSDVSIATAGLDIDLLHVRGAMRDGIAAQSTARLLELEALFRGGFLDGLELVDCYRFHSFWIAHREQMQEAQVAILSALVERHAAQPQRALEFARKRVERDPLSEAAHLAVIRILAALGRTRDALAQVETCARLFQSELQARPSAEMERARIALTAPPSPLAPSVRSEPVPPQRPASERSEVRGKELIGREPERAELRRFLEEEMPCLLITGEAGLGKSRLLEELREQHAARGGVALAGRAFEAEMIRPYGPWIDALGEARWAAASEQGASDRAQLFAAVSTMLGKLAEAQPLLLAFDDVQWFDEASLALLHNVVRGHPSRGARLRIALTARPDELEDNAQASKTMRGLRRESLCRMLALEPLDAGAIRAWMQPLVPAELAERIALQSGGVPLYAIELSRAAHHGAGEPDSLHRLIGDRLQLLSEGGREIAGWAAALGRNFDFATMRALSAMDETGLVEALETLDRRGFIRAREGGFDFVHDLFRTGAYRALSEPRRRLMHLRIARALFAAAEARKSAELMGDVAHHAQLGGDDELSATACVAAGERCRKLFAYEEAVALANRGLHAIEKLPDDSRLRLRMKLLRLCIYPGAARAELQRRDAQIAALIEEARALALHDVVADACHARLFTTYWLDDWGDAFLQSLALTRAGKRASGAEAARHLAGTAACLAQLCREIPQALALVDEAARAAQGSSEEISELDWASGCLAYVQGNLEVGVPLLLRAFESSRAETNQWPAWDALCKVVRFYIEADRPAEALPHCEELLAFSARLGEGSELPFSRALQAIARGDDDPDAPAQLRLALEQLRALDAKAAFAYCAAWAARRVWRKGDLAQARVLAEQSRAAAEKVESQTEIVEARLILAELSSLEGARDAALALLTPLQPLLDAQLKIHVPTARKLRTALQAFQEKPHALHRRRVQVRPAAE